MQRYFLLYLLTASAIFAQLPSGVEWTQQIVNSNPAFPWDQAKAIAIDPAGNIYVAGVTYSTGLATTAGVVQPSFAGGGKACRDALGVSIPCSDAFVAKYDSQGGLIFLTYLGGTRDEIVNSVVADASGVYISGSTGSANFPVTANTFGVAPPLSGYANFVTKLSADGSSIVYSALINVNSNAFGGIGTNSAFIAVGANSTFYVATVVGSDVNAESCSLQRVDPASTTVLASTSFPANCGALATGPDGAVYIAGLTSGGLPATAGEWQSEPAGGDDFYVAKLDASLSTVEWATYVGTPANESGVPYLAVNSDSEVFLASFDLVRLSPDGTRALYATNLPVHPTAIAADANGQVVLSVTGNSFLAVGGPWPCTQAVSPIVIRDLILRFDASGNPNFATWSGPSVPAAGLVVPSPDHLLVAGDVALPEEGLPETPFGLPSIPLFNGAFPITSMLSTIPGPPQLVGTCVVQSGSPYLRATALPGADGSGQAGIAPGEVISIYGTGIGPAQGIQIPARSLSYPTSLGGVQVFFDDIAVPLLYVSANQINAVAPFELAGKSSTVVRVQGTDAATNAVQVPVALSAPEILNVANADATANSHANPAHIGDIITIYASGAGLMFPDAADGLVPTSAARGIQLQVSITVGGTLPPDFPMMINPQPAAIYYLGEAPLQISGIVQINFQIPNFNIGALNKIKLTVGAASGSADFWVR